MTNFTEEIKRMGDQTVTLGGVTYKLKTDSYGATFHIIPPEGDIPNPIDLTYPELKALIILTRGEKQK